MLTVLLAACSDPGKESDPCAVNDLLVPACGVLVGVTPPNPSEAALAKTEKAMGGTSDFVYRFHDIDDEIPTAQERAMVERGTHLHISIDSRRHGNGGEIDVRWADVASGALDGTLRTQARGIASLKTPVWVTFDHEADQEAREPQGSASDFIAAWRRVHDLFADEGASNAVWTWVVMGTGPRLQRAGALWPGNEYVDWISWEAYDPGGCRGGKPGSVPSISFGQALDTFFTWLRTTGQSLAIDVDKPMMISEAGSAVRSATDTRRAHWYAGIPAALGHYPQIKAVGLWDHAGNSACDYTFSDDPAVSQAVADMAARLDKDPPPPRAAH